MSGVIRDDEAVNTLHDSPDEVELLKAVRAFLSSEVLPRADKELVYGLRIAVNVLDILERQLQSQSADSAEFTRQLLDLGYRDQTALAVALRTGSAQWNDPLIGALVRWTTNAKVAVSRPKLLSLDPPM